MPERVAKRKQSIRGQDGEDNGHRLAETDGAGNRGAAEDKRREKTELDAIRLIVGDAVATKTICAALWSAFVSTAERSARLTEQADRRAGNQAGLAPCPDIAGSPARRCQRGEDVRWKLQALHRVSVCARHPPAST